MSTKTTLLAGDRSDTEPGFHLYEDGLDQMFSDLVDAPEEEAPVYLALEGVDVAQLTMSGGQAHLTVKLPRETARKLGLLPPKTTP